MKPFNYENKIKIRVYFQISIWDTNSGNCSVLEFNTKAQALKVFNKIESGGLKVQLCKVQTAGKAGGIILGGSREIIDTK